MRYEKYLTEVDDTAKVYEFISVGVKGFIKKRVIFEQIGDKNIFNLAFGDVDIVTNEFDDVVITNNGDSDKVLATVAATVYNFLEKYPNAIVVATGSTPSRTRLYKIGISKNLEEIQEDFMIMGLKEKSQWVKYNKSESYSAFYIQRR
jgi:hypothetical protein